MANGHRLSEVMRYTPEQIELFVEAGGLRHRRELVEFAQMVFVGASSSLTGSPKPLQQLERTMLGSATSASSELQGTLQQHLRKFAQSAGARIDTGKAKPHGTHGRRAKRLTQRTH